MHTLLALILTAAAAIVIARPPPGPVVTTASHEDAGLHTPTRKYLKDYVLPRYLWPHYFALDETPMQSDQQPQQQPSMPATEWLNQEIQRLSLMQQGAANPFNPEVPRQVLRNPSYIKRWPSSYDMGDYQSNLQSHYVKQPWLTRNLVSEESVLQQAHEMNEVIKEISVPVSKPIIKEQKSKEFALTPRDEGYFEPIIKDNSSVTFANFGEEGINEGGGHQILPEGVTEPATNEELELHPRRQIRQNPNLSHTKTLIAKNLDKLRIGLGHEESGSMDSSRNVLNATPETDENFYGVALLSAIGAAVVLAVLGFAIGWYTLSKRSKAAADVDYPTYGVTGPTVDTPGDRKLAHSAHMYHYQHQKQQIIAMERNGMEQRSGSVSDPESEDENEEGDYTVYECPGFATTGEMEVKNPLFNEEPTPATPGKCEVMKPQPKD